MWNSWHSKWGHTTLPEWRDCPPGVAFWGLTLPDWLKSGSSLKGNANNDHKLSSKVALISVNKKVNTGTKFYKVYMHDRFFFFFTSRNASTVWRDNVQFLVLLLSYPVSILQVPGCFLSSSLIRYSANEELWKAIAIKTFSESMWVAHYTDSSGDSVLAKFYKKKNFISALFRTITCYALLRLQEHMNSDV